MKKRNYLFSIWVICDICGKIKIKRGKSLVELLKLKGALQGCLIGVYSVGTKKLHQTIFKHAKENKICTYFSFL